MEIEQPDKKGSLSTRKCSICGFEGGVARHHIIKRVDCGSDSDDNLVCLCPNHHWIADFGTEEQRKEVINLIKQFTGKSGTRISDKEKEELDIKIRALEEEYLCGIPFSAGEWGSGKPFTKEDWENHKNTSNYLTTRSMLLGRGCSAIQSQLLHRRAEILLLIRNLKSELNNIRL